MSHSIARFCLAGKWWCLLMGILSIQLTLCADQIIYNGALQNGWQNWSWATVNFANTSPVSAGKSSSISVTCQGYQALYVRGNSFNPSLYASLSFWVNGG